MMPNGIPRISSPDADKTQSLADVMEHARKVPICSLCRHYKKVEQAVTYSLPGRFWWSRWEPRDYKTVHHLCTNARHPIHGYLLDHCDCISARDSECGCGPTGRLFEPRPVAELLKIATAKPAGGQP